MISNERFNEENNSLIEFNHINHPKREGQDYMNMKYHRCPIAPNFILCYTLDVETNGYERREIFLANTIFTTSQDAIMKGVASLVYSSTPKASIPHLICH